MVLQMMRRFYLVALLAALGMRAAPLPDEHSHFETLLRQAHVIQPGFFLVHLSHTCDLRVDGMVVSVLDVRQLLNQGPSVRGQNTIVLWGSEPGLIGQYPYVNQRPLDCRGTALRLESPLSLGSGEAGNLWVFSERGKKITVKIDADADAEPPSQETSPERKDIGRALEQQHGFNSEATVRHFSHVCDLIVEGQKWRVMDVVQKAEDEWEKHIVLFDSRNHIGQTIFYETERPLFCDGNRLIVYGELRPTEFTPPGNILVFRKIGPPPATERVDWPEIISDHLRK